MAKKSIRNECDPTKDGVLECRRVTQNSDGSKEVLATSRKRVDANCVPISDGMSGQEGELDKLNDFMDNRLKIQCPKGKPGDY